MNILRVMLFALTMTVGAAACSIENESSPPPRFDVTLEPSQIAANLRTTPAATPTQPPATPEAVSLSPIQAAQAATAAVPATAAPTLQPSPALPTPTSNAAELKAMTENPNLIAVMEMDAECFLANDYIPFRLKVISLETQPIYFYKNGKWLLSINNSPLGPQLASLEPTLREDFVTIEPNESYEQVEEDLGLWVLSLGPDSGIPLTPTGVGLPVGEYWVTFMYNNDQDGLTEQVDGTYLIDKAAWRGTAVAEEVRFKVVEDLAQCQGE